MSSGKKTFMSLCRILEKNMSELCLELVLANHENDPEHSEQKSMIRIQSLGSAISI